VGVAAHASSLGSFSRAAYASSGNRMPRRSVRSVARHRPRVVGSGLVARLVQPCGTGLVWQPNAWSLGCFRLAAVRKAGHQPKHHGRRSAQPAAVADAAVRPRDRAFFEGWNRTRAVPVYECGAAKRQPVGPHLSTLYQMEVTNVVQSHCQAHHWQANSAASSTRNP